MKRRYKWPLLLIGTVGAYKAYYKLIEPSFEDKLRLVFPSF